MGVRVHLTNNQFEQMPTRLMRVRPEGAVGQAQVGGGESNAAAIGPMQPCTLGIGYESGRSKWIS